MDNARGAGGFGRWLGFVTAVWVQCISGNNYSFSNYSHALKTIMGLTQLQLNNLSVAKDVGKAFGLLAGLASDRLSTPVILLIGVLEGLLGYGAQWLVVRQSIRPLPYWQMCVFLCMGGNSTTWMNTAVLVTCMRNFRRNRGPVSGILKGYVGLSTAIFTDLCTALFADDPAKFLLMLAVVPAIVCISAMLFLREEPSGAGEAEEGYDAENKYFGVINAMAVVIAVYLLGFNVTGEHSVVVSRIFVSILAVLLLAPLAVPLHIRLTAAPKPKAASSELDVENSPNTQPLLTEGTAAAAAAVGTVEAEEKRNAQQAAEGKKKGPAIGEDHSIMEALSTADFWVLFASFLCGVGTGLTVMNNMGQMGQAMGYDDVSMFVSLISICGFFGRIGSGTISEYFIQTHAIPRPLWNAASQMVMAGGYVVMAVGLPGSLYVGSVVVGLCYGVRLAVSVPTASELFGLKYYGLIYNVLILNLPLGSFLFSGLLAGLLYDAQATKTDDGGNTCVGAHCYRMVFVIMAVACVVGLALDVVLALRTTKLYKKIHMSKKLQAGGVRATNS